MGVAIRFQVNEVLDSGKMAPEPARYYDEEPDAEEDAVRTAGLISEGYVQLSMYQQTLGFYTVKKIYEKKRGVYAAV